MPTSTTISPASLSDDERFMRMALAEAHAAGAAGEIPIGAVIVSRGIVLSRAHNLTETLCDVTAHAEMQAITAAANTTSKLKDNSFMIRCVDKLFLMLGLT